MKYCVMHNLRLETPSKRDKLDDDIKLKVGGKPVWGETVISKGKDEEGYPSHGLEIRFDTEADMDELYDFIKGRIEKIPILKGTVSKHYCSHDETPQPCQIIEEYSKGGK